MSLATFVFTVSSPQNASLVATAKTATKLVGTASTTHRAHTTLDTAQTQTVKMALMESFVNVSRQRESKAVMADFTAKLRGIKNNFE